jgi:hypothetical protein
MFKRLNQHLQGNNILAPEQFGFRKDITIEKHFLHELVIFLLR